MNGLSHRIEVPHLLFEELQFRFFKRFNAARKPTNQYGFFDESVRIIDVNDIDTSFALDEWVYLYFFYRKKANLMLFTNCKSDLHNFYNQNLQTNESEILFVFNRSFSKLIVISDEELDNKLFKKEI